MYLASLHLRLEALKVTDHDNETSAIALGASDCADTVLAEYMTSDELASELGVCKRTLDRWHSRRIGPPRVTIGRKPLYRRGGVADWIRSRELDFDEQKFSRRAPFGRR